MRNNENEKIVFNYQYRNQSNVEQNRYLSIYIFLWWEPIWMEHSESCLQIALKVLWCRQTYSKNWSKRLQFISKYVSNINDYWQEINFLTTIVSRDVHFSVDKIYQKGTNSRYASTINLIPNLLSNSLTTYLNHCVTIKQSFLQLHVLESNTKKMCFYWSNSPSLT